MNDPLRPPMRQANYRGQINRAHSPVLAGGTPWATIMLGSLAPVLPVIPAVPVLPPFGFLLLLGWRLVRPGLLPLWAGVPLGLFDDLFSGQPFGSAILLWSLALIAVELVEARFPWRGFLHDWQAAAALIILYIVASAVFSGGKLSVAPLVLGPQILLSILSYPIVAQMIALFDRMRLARIRKIG